MKTISHLSRKQKKLSKLKKQSHLEYLVVKHDLNIKYAAEYNNVIKVIDNNNQILTYEKEAITKMAKIFNLDLETKNKFRNAFNLKLLKND